MTKRQLLTLATETALADWDNTVNQWKIGGEAIYLPPTPMDRGSIQDAVRDLDRYIVCLARFREYIEQRDGAGCGDQGHEAAVKAQNKLATKVRRALGFTFPEKGNVKF